MNDTSVTHTPVPGAAPGPAAAAHGDPALARRRTREAARVRRSGRRGAAAVTGLVGGLGLAVVAADLAAVAVRGTRPFAVSVPVVGGLSPVDPAAAGRTLADLPSTPAAAWIAVAALAVVGAWLVGLGLRPGGRTRRVLVPADPSAPSAPEAVVADRGVVADALGDVTRRAAGLPPEQVSVRLGRRADVVVRPLNGAPVDVAGVGSALAPAVARWGLARSRAGRRPERFVPVRVRVADRGTVAS